MNCQSCQKESDAYLRGKLPEGTRIQLEQHLENCRDCAESFRLMSIAIRVIDQEKEFKPNPFLVTRIMAGIEELDRQTESPVRSPVYLQLLRSALLSTSIAAAIFVGVMVGSIYTPVTPENQLPVELAYLNDAALESVDLLSQE